MQYLIDSSDGSEAEKQMFAAMLRPAIGSGEVWTRTGSLENSAYANMFGTGMDGEPVHATYGVLPAMRITR